MHMILNVMHTIDNGSLKCWFISSSSYIISFIRKFASYFTENGVQTFFVDFVESFSIVCYLCVLLHKI